VLWLSEREQEERAAVTEQIARKVADILIRRDTLDTVRVT
jgi:hypothetical protein